VPKATEYEYQVLQVQAARSAHINERLGVFALEGWEPVFMCGETALTIMLRRKREEHAPSAQPAS